MILVLNTVARALHATGIDADEGFNEAETDCCATCATPRGILRSLKLAPVCFAGITVGHEVRKESRASQGYSDCRDAPYSCKVLSGVSSPSSPAHHEPWSLLHLPLCTVLKQGDGRQGVRTSTSSELVFSQKSRKHVA